MSGRTNAPEETPVHSWVYTLAWFLSFILLGLVVKLSINGHFGRDEFEAIKSAWKISHGEKIYIDFFQHHHPFLYYLLTPVINFFGETRATLYAARTLMLGFSLGSLIVIYLLAKEIYSKHVATIAVFFTFALGFYFDKATEIRPDVPQAFFGLLAILFLFQYLKRNQRIHLMLSAVCLILGFLFLQKLLILAIVLVSLLSWRVYKGQQEWRSLLLYVGILICGVGVYGIYLTYTDQLQAFLFFNYEFNLTRLDRQHHQTAILYSHFSKFNGVLLFFLLLGIVIKKNREQFHFVLITLALLTVALLYRTQYLQYYIVVFPLIAIVSASGWYALARHYLYVGFACLIAAFALSSVYYVHSASRSNLYQLSRIDYVTKNTTPADYVYDGDIQFNLYRKDIDFMWFGVGKDPMEKYSQMTGYAYDVYAQIEIYRPLIISDKKIPDMKHPSIRNHYKKSKVYKRLYVRTQ